MVKLNFALSLFVCCAVCGAYMLLKNIPEYRVIGVCTAVGGSVGAGVIFTAIRKFNSR